MAYKTDQRYGTAQWKRLRVRILERDERTCGYCGDEATTVDHRIPISRGGDFWAESNLVAACARCNFGKRDRLRPGRGTTTTSTPAASALVCRFHGTACGAVHSRDW